MKRYDGNPSGHIHMDNRYLNFSKELIGKETHHREKMREKGLDQPGIYKKLSAEIFPTPRSARAVPQTDRKVVLFRDYVPIPSYAQSQVATATPNLMHTAELAVAGSTAAAKGLVAAAKESLRSQEERNALMKRKNLIERQLSELDEVLALKARQEQKKRRPVAERPFANFMDTYRAKPEVCDVTPTVTGSWEREKNE
mmetsp:Transcript_75559/g.151870  ORF Transcript_75559/g.151870 Transcript_75559/m.151870 type:complete len:198 (-) Transcript_75559:211-804(-)